MNTPEQHEHAAAKLIYAEAVEHAKTIVSNPLDAKAQAIAILMAALAVATPGLSDDARLALVMGRAE